MTMEKNKYKNVQTAIDDLLGIKCVVKRKKKTEQNKKKELFLHIIHNIEHGIIRSNIAYSEFGIDYSDYDETYFAAIDALLLLSFGKDAAELIVYYLWDRTNTDGTINPIYDEKENEIIIKNANELWDLLCKLDPKF